MSGPDNLAIGIDENGLGPRLGPLIVTAAVARTTGNGRAVVASAARGALRTRIADSKKLVSFADSALGEAWARALTRPKTGGASLASPDDVVRALSVDPQATLERPCPTDHRAQCWGTTGERFEADEPLVTKVTGDLDGLRARGVDVIGVHVAIVCTERLNEATARGVTRFQQDLHAMERLILHARERYGQEVDATCGKVGGYASYPKAFGPLAGHLFTTVEEGRARSAYVIAGVGRIAFVRDADDAHLLVSLASLVGKWVRDLFTRRVTRYHRAHDPELPEASGYNDPVTTAFIEGSALARKKRGVPDACFERRAVPTRR
jgi:ribonuclease HII